MVPFSCWFHDLHLTFCDQLRNKHTAKTYAERTQNVRSVLGWSLFVGAGFQPGKPSFLKNSLHQQHISRAAAAPPDKTDATRTQNVRPEQKGGGWLQSLAESQVGDLGSVVLDSVAFSHYKGLHAIFPPPAQLEFYTGTGSDR